MIRFLATWFAKWSYRWKNEREAGLNFWMGKVQEKKAAEARKQLASLNADADAREARIKQMAEMEEKGYWMCEHGHESDITKTKMDDGWHGIICGICERPGKFIKRSVMSGQEKYESDKERKESEDLLEAARQDIAAHEKQAETHDAAAKYFMQRATQARAEADDVRNL